MTNKMQKAAAKNQSGRETVVNSAEIDDMSEKDATEVELERILFGDDDGFFKGLRSYEDIGNLGDSSLWNALGDTDDDEDGQKVALEGVRDADLFFVDTQPSSTLPTTQSDSQIEVEKTLKAGRSPAWVDSDDERMTISLAGNPQLRKLRISGDEDIINGAEYTKRLRVQFERLQPPPPWAEHLASRLNHGNKRRRLENSDSESSHDESADENSYSTDDVSMQPLARLLQHTENLMNTSTLPQSHKKLRPEIIDIHRLKDVGETKPCALTNLSFHPTYSLLLMSGPSSTLYLHHVFPQSPVPNVLLTSLHLSSTPLTTSLFLPPHGNEIFFSGRRRYFHVWDLESGHIKKITRVIGHKDEQRSMERFKLSPCGRWMGLVGSARKGGGFVNILDSRTCQWVAEVRVEGRGGVADFNWWGDGNGLVLIGKGGEAVEWDVREKRVVSRWLDEGAVGSTVVSLGGRGAGPKELGGDRWLAVGSSSGIVNVYDRRKWSRDIGNTAERPKPVRAFDHLTTPTSHLEFSPDGQLLCMASRWKRDALRLVHLPSCTVYRNWPTAQTPFGRITGVSWSPNGQMLVVGNEQGKCRLWEIRN